MARGRRTSIEFSAEKSAEGGVNLSVQVNAPQGLTEAIRIEIPPKASLVVLSKKLTVFAERIHSLTFGEEDDYDSVPSPPENGPEVLQQNEVLE